MDLAESFNPSSLQNYVRTEAPEHVDEIQDNEVAAFVDCHADVLSPTAPVPLLQRNEALEACKVDLDKGRMAVHLQFA